MRNCLADVMGGSRQGEEGIGTLVLKGLINHAKVVIQERRAVAIAAERIRVSL